MEPDFKSIVWFVDVKNKSFGAAVNCLEENGVETKNCFQNQIMFKEGILKRKGKDDIKIYLILSAYFREPVRKIIETADATLFSGTCSGRPGLVRLGDIICVKSCYHIGRRAVRQEDGSVDYNNCSVETSENVITQLEKLKQAKIDVGQALPSSDNDRREAVLTYLNNSGKSLRSQEFLNIATDENADDETRDKQWQNFTSWLKDNNEYIDYDDDNMTITEKGKTYCLEIDPSTFEHKPEHPTVHIGATVTSDYIHEDLKDKESWEEFDTDLLKGPILGLDGSVYDILSQYPNTIVIEAVKNHADGDKGSSISEYAHKTAAKAALYFISNILD